MNYSNLKFLGPIIVFGVLILCHPSMATEPPRISIVKSIDFGTIIPDPSGGSIEIDASRGEAAPRVYDAGDSIVQDGHSGLILIRSEVPGEEIHIMFPNQLHFDGEKCLFRGFQSRSTQSPIRGSGDEWEPVHIGGVLRIPKGQSHLNKTVKMQIIIQVDNP